MCRCQDCYRPTRSTRGEDQPVSPCNIFCGLWVPLYYIFVLLLSAGIVLWVIGPMTVKFFTLARDNFVEEECLLIRNETIYEYDEGSKEKGFHYFYMIVPFTAQNDPVYEMWEASFVRDEGWRSKEPINGTYMWGGDDEKSRLVWGRPSVETGVGWLKTEPCWREPGAMHEDMNIIWSPQKALDTGMYQDIEKIGIAFTIIGILSLLSLPYCAPRAFPLCMDWAVLINVASTALVISVGSLTATLLAFLVGRSQFKPYKWESGAWTAGIVCAVLTVLCVVVSMAACIRSCVKMRQHHREVGNSHPLVEHREGETATTV